MLEWISFALTTLGLLFNTLKWRACWPVWIASNVTWIACYLPRRDMAICAQNLVFFFLNLYGWCQWQKSTKK